jgi:hypothetical protein
MRGPGRWRPGAPRAARPITDTYPPRPAKGKPACAENKPRTHSRRRDARRAMAAFDDREGQHADAAHRTLPVLSMAAETTSTINHSVSLGILINSKRRRPRISMRRHAVAFRLPITRMPTSAARLGEDGLPAETGHRIQGLGGRPRSRCASQPPRPPTVAPTALQTPDLRSRPATKAGLQLCLAATKVVG